MNPLQQGAESSKFLQDDWFQKFMESVRKVPLDNIKVKLPKDLREDHVEGPTGPEEEDVDDIKDPTVFEEPKFGKMSMILWTQLFLKNQSSAPMLRDQWQLKKMISIKFSTQLFSKDQNRFNSSMSAVKSFQTSWTIFLSRNATLSWISFAGSLRKPLRWLKFKLFLKIFGISVQCINRVAHTSTSYDAEENIRI